MIKTIEDFPGYFVDEHGEVGSIKKNKFIVIKGNIIKGYKSVGIRKPDSKRVHLKRHRLVAMLFVSNPNNLPVVNHIDGDKFNNYYLNLEWTTAKDNSTHAASIGKYLWTSKMVLNTQTGIFYTTITAAAMSTGIFSECYIGKMLSGKTPNRTNLILYDIKYK